MQTVLVQDGVEVGVVRLWGDESKLRCIYCDPDGLCCTNLVRDSSRESSVVAGLHEQTHTYDLQDQELGGL